jgi:folate-binding protein YgfZ
MAALHGSARFGLDTSGLLAVEGRDAADFLHRQLSSNVLALEPGHAALTSCSDPKGRVLAVARIWATPERFLLELPPERVEPLRAHLAKFVLRSAVQLTPLSTQYTRFGVAGQSASVALAGLLGTLPQAIYDGVTGADGTTVTRLRGPRPRWLVHGPPEAVADVWRGLAGQTCDANADQWRLLEIEAGIPSIRDATVGQFVAQMLNLDRLGAIDFDKGCYPGQEVIAKTHYLGRLKRRTYVVHIAGGERHDPGTNVYAGATDVGTLLDAVPHPEGGAMGLAVVRTDRADQSLAIGRPDGPAARADEPPYALADAA